MKTKVVLFLLLSIFIFGFGQNNPRPQVDFDRYFSLQMELLSKADPENYAVQYLELQQQVINRGDKDQLLDLYIFHANYMIQIASYDSALLALHKAKRLYPVKSKDLVPVHLILGATHFYKSNLDSLFFYQELVKSTISESSPNYSLYLHNEGLKSQANSNFKEAIERILEAIKLFEQQGDTKRLAVAYNNLAFNFERLGDWDLHDYYMRKAVDLNKALGNTFHLIMNYNNLGISYKGKDLLDEAINFYDLAFEELQKLNNPMLKAQNLMNRGNIFKEKGDLTSSEAIYGEALSICRDNGIDYGAILCLLNLGDLYRMQKRFETSRESLDAAFELAKQMGLRREKALLYERMAWLARDQKDFEEAYENINNYHALQDSLVNESVRNSANELREKYETEKKENEILTLSKDKIYQQYIIAMMVIVLVLLLIALQWWKNKQKVTHIKLALAEKLSQAKEEALKQRERDLLEETMEKIVLKEQLKELVDEVSKNGYNGKIGTQLRSLEGRQNPWNNLLEKFKLLNPQLVDNLFQSYPQLNQNDLEFCSLIKMNLSTKEIAQILRITDQSVRTRKYRLLKKLKLSRETDLGTWIDAFNPQD